jgi:hypothetical protein
MSMDAKLFREKVLAGYNRINHPNFCPNCCKVCGSLRIIIFPIRAKRVVVAVCWPCYQEGAPYYRKMVELVCSTVDPDELRAVEEPQGEVMSMESVEKILFATLHTGTAVRELR